MQHILLNLKLLVNSVVDRRNALLVSNAHIQGKIVSYLMLSQSS